VASWRRGGVAVWRCGGVAVLVTFLNLRIDLQPHKQNRGECHNAKFGLAYCRVAMKIPTAKRGRKERQK